MASSPSPIADPRRGRTRARLARWSVVALVVNVAYLVWRAIETRAGTDAWFFVLFGVELIGFARLVVELLLAGSAAPATAVVAHPDATEARADVLFMVHDQSLRTVRSHLLAACHASGAQHVAIIDLSGRAAVADLAARLGCAYAKVDEDASIEDVAARAVAEGAASNVLLVDADHSVLPSAIATLAHALGADDGAVVGACDEVNAKRGVDRHGLGDGEFWHRAVVANLSVDGQVPAWDGVALVARGALVACGGLRSADDRSLTHTARALLANGRSVRAVPVVVSRRLAPGSLGAAQRRYVEVQLERLLALRPARRERVPGLGGLAVRAALVVPARLLQRLLLLGVLWAVMLGSASPLGASGSALGGFWALRVGTGRIARSRRAGRGIAPWAITDARVLTSDLVLCGALLRGRTSAGGRRAWLLARWLVRAVHGATSVLLLSVASGFVRVGSGHRGAVALLGAIAVLTASSVARRELRQVQFRRWHRSDAELEVVDDPTLRVVGLSPFGFDVLSPVALVVGRTMALRVVVPVGARREVAALVGLVERAGTVAEGCAAYVRFDGIDAHSEDLVLEHLALGTPQYNPSTSNGFAHDCVNVA